MCAILRRAARARAHSVAEFVSRPDYADRISEALSPGRLEAAVEKGRQMSLEEAFDFAMGLSHDAEAKLTTASG